MMDPEHTRPEVAHTTNAPQIFGNSNSDGSPIVPSLPGPVFGEDNSMGNADDNNDAKRRRIARVCLPLCVVMAAQYILKRYFSCF